MSCVKQKLGSNLTVHVVMTITSASILMVRAKTNPSKVSIRPSGGGIFGETCL